MNKPIVNTIYCPVCDSLMEELFVEVMNDKFLEYRCNYCKKRYELCSSDYLKYLIRHHSQETKETSQESVVGSNVGKVRNSLNRDKEDSNKTPDNYDKAEIKSNYVERSYGI